jgi:4-amino-4-deoxy-L-arabinose transferase-like glycosyltransferase
MSPQRRLGHAELASVIGLLLLAAVLRLYRLQDYPAGYHNDEVALAHAVETAMGGRLAIFFPQDTGHEALYMYWSAPFGVVLGHTVFALRLPSAFLAMMALCAVWALTRRLFGPLPAGVALAAMSVSWWSVLLGRITLHVIAVAPTLALAMYFLCRAAWSVEREAKGSVVLPFHPSHSTLYFVLSGAFFALAFNAYTAARVMPLLFLVLVAYLALVRRDVIRRHWHGLLALFAVAFVLCLPLAIYLITHPGAKQLSYASFNADQPVTDLLAGRPQLVIKTALQTLGMFALAGDPLPALNIPGRPLFEPVGAALFLIGAAVALWRWRDPRYGVVLIGLVVTLLPGMFSQPAPNYAHTVGAMVFAFALPGIGVNVVWRGAIGRWGQAGRRVGMVALAALLLGNLVWTVRDFFIVWPAQPATRWWMQTGLKELADALKVQEQRGPIAVCVPSRLIDERLEWWRPAWMIWHYVSPQSEHDMRWYDCAEAAVIPAGTAHFAFPDAASLDQLAGFPIARWVRAAPDAKRVGGGLLVRADAMPEWSAEVTRLASDLPIAWPPEAAQNQLATLPVDFGHVLQLTAYQVEGHAVPGAVITVTTYWRVTAPPEPRLALFTHVITGTNIVAQADHLAITSVSLQPGDVFLQIHSLQLPDSVERGGYDVEVGLYSQDTGARLPVYDGEARMGDRVFLRSLRVYRR